MPTVVTVVCHISCGLVPHLWKRVFQFGSLLELLLPPQAAKSPVMYITESLWHSLQSSPHSATSNLDLTVVKMILLGLLLKGKVKWSLWGDCRISIPAF